MNRGQKVNLFIVGAPKCGTTAWVSYLSAHPDIYFSPAKEPHFFSADFPGFRWAKSLDEYHDLFAGSGNEMVIGEASVQYLYSREAARNIHDYNPQSKILIFLRRQETFLPAYHNQLLYNTDEDISDFAEAWTLSRDGNRSRYPATCREHSFLDYAAVGKFSEQVARYLDIFPKEQIRIIQFEKWSAAPRETYLELMDFLNVKDDGRTDFEPVHSAHHHRFRSVAALTQRPPKWMLSASTALRRMTGRKRLGLGRTFRKLNESNGYARAVPAELRHEIITHFANDNHSLRLLLAAKGMGEPS